MKKLLMLQIIILFFCTNAYCQVSDQLNDSIYTHVRVTTNDWEEILSDKLCLSTSQKTILLIDKYNNEKKYPLSNINSIEQQSGTRAVLYGIIGAASGFLLAATIASAGDDPNNFDDGMSSEAAGALLIGGTGIGLTAGILLGHRSKRYKKIYYRGEFIH